MNDQRRRGAIFPRFATKAVTYAPREVMPIDESDCAETRLKKKAVIRSKVLSDCETLEGWRPISYLLAASFGTDYGRDDNSAGLATVRLTDERSHSGSHSVYFGCPTNLPELNDVARGRIYAVPTAMLDIPREDWREYNRISAWVYPHAPGMKTITIRLQPHNDGEHKMPDIYDREGAHNVTLKPDQWNYIVLEIPYLYRDCVKGLGFEYDMVGHEPDAADYVEFWIDDVHLDEVDADVYEGWMPKKDRIVYSHAGYAIGAVKTALISDLGIDKFRVLEMESGRVVLEKPVQIVESVNGKFGVMDFSEVAEEGNYMLSAGQLLSRVFPIGEGIWESSVWKDLNFHLIERCGFEVPGHHRKCHGDMLLTHNGKSIVADGGWHDAADLAQNLGNTIEGAVALMDLARGLKDSPKYAALRDRVLEEAKWGMDYVLKMRFGDGFRGTYSSSSIWTDGVIGTGDDIVEPADDGPAMNFNAAYAEALWARDLMDLDEGYGQWCIRTAEEDYAFAFARWDAADRRERRNYEDYNRKSATEILDAEICSLGAMAASLLYAVTGKDSYKEDAHRMGQRLLSCQQQSFTDWDTPMIGFFYQDRDKDLIWHHYHHSQEHHPLNALRVLAETFPDSEDYMAWYEALTFSGKYYKELVKFSAPYGIIPAGVYHEDEPQLGMAKVRTRLSTEAEQKRYVNEVHQGVSVGKGFYVRRFPVWYDFCGNNNVSLSEAVAVNDGAVVRNDPALSQIAQDQQAFIIGANPFGQSLMVGEGHDYIAHYAVQPGQTCGSLTVGMESFEDNDAPFWPQVCTATYKEVWISSATKWIWSNADSLQDGLIYGVMGCGCEITFTHKTLGFTRKVTPDAVTHGYLIRLPFGEYTMEQCGRCRTLTIASGGVRRIDGPLYDLSAAVDQKDGKVTLRICLAAKAGDAPVKVCIRTAATKDLPAEICLEPGEDGSACVELAGTLTDAKKPFVALLVPNGNREDAVEAVCECLK